MIRTIGNQKSSTRLEFHYSTSSKVLLGIVAPVVFGVFGALVFWAAIINVHKDPGDIFTPLLIVGFFGFFFILALLRIPKFFSSEPQIIIDKVGITDNQRWKVLKIPWDDIEEISFPYRYVSRYSRRPVLSIKFRRPHLYNPRVPFLHKLNKLLTPNAGDYEISLYLFDGTASDVYSYLKWLQANRQIPNLQVGELERDEYPWGLVLIISLILLVIGLLIKSNL